MTIRRHALGMLVLLPLQVQAQSAQASAASALSLAPGVSIAEATLAVVPAGTRWIVHGVEHGAHASIVVIEASGAAATASVEVGAEVVGRLSIAAGQAVEVVATGSGYVIRIAGQIVAFVPNEAGRALVHHRRMER